MFFYVARPFHAARQKKTSFARDPHGCMAFSPGIHGSDSHHQGLRCLCSKLPALLCVPNFPGGRESCTRIETTEGGEGSDCIAAAIYSRHRESACSSLSFRWMVSFPETHFQDTHLLFPRPTEMFHVKFVFSPRKRREQRRSFHVGSESVQYGVQHMKTDAQRPPPPPPPPPPSLPPTQ